MLLAIELVQDRETKAPVAPGVMRKLVMSLARRGLLAIGGGHVLRITPPLVISEALVLRGAELLDDALDEVERLA